MLKRSFRRFILRSKSEGVVVVRLGEALTSISQGLQLLSNNTSNP